MRITHIFYAPGHGETDRTICSSLELVNKPTVPRWKTLAADDDSVLCRDCYERVRPYRRQSSYLGSKNSEDKSDEV